VREADKPVIIEAAGLRKQYIRGSETVHALRDVGFQASEAEMIAVVGPSGSGKSTLLHLLGCMDVPTGGSLRIDAVETAGMGDRQLTAFRRNSIGFVFQQFGLVPTLTVLENVLMPTLFSGKKASALAASLLEQVGLSHRANHRPHELSGGEMQRTAIARALINSPRILLADEPTGNLDSSSGTEIMSLFKQLNAQGLTIVLVTHNEAAAAAAGRILTISDGKLASDSRTVGGA
jgi:ABC-type lipoprotein export system ATPase subunit